MCENKVLPVTQVYVANPIEKFYKNAIQVYFFDVLFINLERTKVIV